MNENWGLTEYGFLRPSYTELLDAFEIQAREKFSNRINLSVRSPLGIFLRIFAWTCGILWQISEAVYNSGFIDTASGVSLSRLGLFIGIRRLSAQKAIGTLTVTGDIGSLVPEGFLVQAVNGQQFVTLSDAIIGETGTVDISIQSFQSGVEGNVSAQSIREIITPLPTVSAVINKYATVGGRELETDQEFRERYASSVDKPGGSNVDSIRAELLEIPVVSAQVWENDTDEINADGLLPHSIEAIVYGGLDTDIARTIFEKKSAGINTNGNTLTEVTDDSGRIHTIRFSRPEMVYVWIRVTELVTGKDFGGIDTIISALLNYIGDAANSFTASGLPIGQTVYYNKLLCPVNEVPGVVDYTLEVSLNGQSWSKSNLIISARQKAVTSADGVVISQ